MSKQQADYEEEEYYSSEEDLHGKSAIYIVAYFALLAVMVVPALKMHMGMQGIFFAMMGAGLLLALLIFLFKVIKRKVESTGLSRKELIQFAVGYNPYQQTGEEQMQGEGQQEEEITPPALPEQIIEEYPLVLSERYQPSIKGFLGAMVAIIGMRRSGKSNLLAVLAEELASYGLPFVLFDTESEYSGLVSQQYLRQPVLAGSAELRAEHPDQKHFVALDKVGAYAFGQDVMNAGLQAVVDLASFDDDEEAALVMTEIIDGIEDWQQALANADRVPMTIFLDESQKWFPQNKEDRVVSSEVQTLLNEAFYGVVVARGGKRGFGLVVAAQRYSQLNKKLLQSQHKFLFFQNEEIDVGRYSKLGIPAEGTMSLATGECYAFGPSVIGMRVMVRERRSPHLGHTPGLENLARHTRQMRPVTDVLGKSYSKTTIVLAPSLDEEGEVVETLPEVAKRDQRRKAEEIDLKIAVALWNGGFNSRAKLAKALDIAENQAGKLMGLMNVNQPDGRMDG